VDVAVGRRARLQGSSREGLESAPKPSFRSGLAEAFVHRVHILGAELAQAHAGGGVGCLAMSGICYATADETNKSG